MFNAHAYIRYYLFQGFYFSGIKALVVHTAIVLSKGECDD